MCDNLIVIIYLLLFETCLLVICFWILSVSSSCVNYFILCGCSPYVCQCIHVTLCTCTIFVLELNDKVTCSLFLFDWQYILKESAKNTTQKDKSTFIVVARREDQPTTSSGIDIFENETGNFFIFLLIMNLSKPELFNYGVSFFICHQLYRKFQCPTSVQDNWLH